MGQLVWLLSPRRSLAIENVSRALNAPRKEAHRIARASHLHLARVGVEILMIDAFTEPRHSGLLELVDFENLREAKSYGRGVVQVTAHLGNWELLALRQAREGIPLKAIGRTPKNPYLARRLARAREMAGNRWLPPHQTLLHAARELKRGGCVATAIDQFSMSQPHAIVDFFHRPTCISTALFELAVRLGSPILPSISLPKASGGYRIIYHPAEWPYGLGGREAQVENLAKRCVRLIENYIRMFPDTWFWFHDLWKDRPRWFSSRPPGPRP